ncbi:hypothetical protein CDL15_Pgr021232 [Punica granatum]|uniref:Uncharacterized protein n=1 Tax=Punica granatum TaxID=22663 RepID=A0A218WRN1_PUNGR|nr:hypothetical protein CDL15_Pgr021232 [Punica granatum]
MTSKQDLRKLIHIEIRPIASWSELAEATVGSVVMHIGGVIDWAWQGHRVIDCAGKADGVANMQAGFVLAHIGAMID